MNDLLLPEGTRLLHIGPHKTGTTALQGALNFVRDDLGSYGVIYPGRMRQHWKAALAVTGHRGLKGDPIPSTADWDRLKRQVSAAGARDRVVISSEFWGEADAATARTVVEGLGGPQVHVLVTLRPLSKILPSAWQQYVRNGHQTSYLAWLEGMLNKAPYNRPTPSFWRRHDHGQLVERWASIVGPENLTVIILDESDRSMLMRNVELLLGLPEGLLEPEPGRTNRSLTVGEIELVRQINIEFRRRNWPDRLYHDFVFGMTQHLQEARRPTPDESQIATPAWALDRAAQIGDDAAARISAVGVRIVGDISSLGTKPTTDASRGADNEPRHIPIDVAREAVIGTIAAGTGRSEIPLNEISTRKLSGIVAQRIKRRVSQARRSVQSWIGSRASHTGHRLD